MSDDGDLSPEARRIQLEGIDLDRILRERGDSEPAMRRHDQIAQTLRDLRDHRIAPAAARAELHRIDPVHYPHQ